MHRTSIDCALLRTCTKSNDLSTMRTTEDPIYGKPPSPLYLDKFIHFFFAKRADWDNVNFPNIYGHPKLPC